MSMIDGGMEWDANPGFTPGLPNPTPGAAPKRPAVPSVKPASIMGLDPMKMYQENEAKRAELEKKLDASNAERDEALKTRMKGLDEDSKAVMDAMSLPAPKREEVPLPDPNLGPMLDPKQYQNFAYGMLALAAMGAIGGRKHWQNAASALDGALQGYMKGNMEVARMKKEEFDREFKIAQSKQAKADKEYADIVNNRQLSLNQKIKLMEIHAAKNGLAYDAALAKSKDWEGLLRSLDTSNGAAIKMAEYQESMKDKKEARAANAEARAASKGMWMRSPDGGVHYVTAAMADAPGADFKGWQPVAGGKSGAQGGGWAAASGNRMIQASSNLNAAVRNIVQLPLDVSSGIFAGREQGPGLLDATKEILANKVTDEMDRNYNIMMAGVKRQAAQLEAAGAATGLVGLTKSMDVLDIKKGDTIGNAAHVLAEIRQIVEGSVRPLLVSPQTSDEQRKLLRDIVKETQETIPFTHEDLLKVERDSKGLTLKDAGSERAKEVGGALPSRAPRASSSPDIDALLKKYGG